jgi:hypothetical protein
MCFWKRLAGHTIVDIVNAMHDTGSAKAYTLAGCSEDGGYLAQGHRSSQAYIRADSRVLASNMGQSRTDASAADFDDTILYGSLPWSWIMPPWNTRSVTVMKTPYTT